MEEKLKELIGHPDIWLFIRSSNGWVKDVEILEVNPETVSFRYQHESNAETKVWEKTTRLDNVLEIDIRVTAIPKCEEKLQNVRSRFTRLLNEGNSQQG